MGRGAGVFIERHVVEGTAKNKGPMLSHWSTLIESRTFLVKASDTQRALEVDDFNTEK